MSGIFHIAAPPPPPPPPPTRPPPPQPPAQTVVVVVVVVVVVWVTGFHFSSNIPLVILLVLLKSDPPCTPSLLWPHPCTTLLPCQAHPHTLTRTINGV